MMDELEGFETVKPGMKLSFQNRPGIRIAFYPMPGIAEMLSIEEYRQLPMDFPGPK
jgi:hypothetical protein